MSFPTEPSVEVQNVLQVVLAKKSAAPQRDRRATGPYLRWEAGSTLSATASEIEGSGHRKNHVRTNLFNEDRQARICFLSYRNREKETETSDD